MLRSHFRLIIWSGLVWNNPKLVLEKSQEEVQSDPEKSEKNMKYSWKVCYDDDSFTKET